MKRCQNMVDIGRRQFLRGTGTAAAGVATAASLPQQQCLRHPLVWR
jgi:arsenite oxidase small subunit